MVSRKAKSCCLAFLSLALAVLFVLPFSKGIYHHFFAWQTSLVNDSKLVGDQIVIALNRYFEDQGRYPEELNDLVPKYIEMIPHPVAGDKKWRYKTDNKNKEYVLSFVFDDSEYPNCRYYSASKAWEEDA